MTKTIQSIRALQPGEKLIVQLAADMPPERIEHIATTIETFLNSDNLRVMIVGDEVDVLYVLKDGDEVLLKDELNKD